ncbi:GNAT family N-acetyltransferase [Nostoc flagelliforme FACHB-838]|uniref:GNAT family N-acetyltransferase n=1 Tax=Nostoc flagelliforme FACHB-838 TaxID=2692904 RepID=A0ABR8E668_9NOSO|nr:GNAT family N-acetyltransferase [Nostoc flagelliforme]MBD2537064.1 GNAT family N-acetyltransferase [Nostoc flagelliforme FACHB-838]
MRGNDLERFLNVSNLVVLNCVADKRHPFLFQMKLQPIEHQHLKECANLFVSVFSNPPWNENWEIESAFNRLEDFYNMPWSHSVVAILEERIIGFAIGYIERWHQGNSFYLKEMCVESTKQQSGVGTKIMDVLSQNLVDKGVNKIYLLTARDSLASAFYSKCGFCNNSKIIMMSKTL